MPQKNVSYDVIVGVDSLHVRDWFKTSAKEIGLIHAGEKVHITIEYDSGPLWGFGHTSVGDGWICEKDIDPNGKPVWYVNPVPVNPPPDPDPDPTPTDGVTVIEIGPRLEAFLRQLFRLS
jgi:hypothetical protein